MTKTQLTFAIIMLFGIAGFISAEQPEPAERVLGKAFDLETQELLYQEEHVWKNGQHSVIYTSPQGDVFAEKRIRYDNGMASPSFVLENQWAGEVIDVQWQGDTNLTAFYSNNVKATERGPASVNLPKVQPIVIDAGFVAFVNQNWEALAAGETIKFHYLVPTILKTVALKVENVPSQRKGILRFKISSQSWIVNQVVDPIFLYYNENRDLLEFKGRGNIADPTGGYLSVHILYNPV